MKCELAYCVVVAVIEQLRLLLLMLVQTSEIEICPDCYKNSCAKPTDDWFCEPCVSY